MKEKNKKAQEEMVGFVLIMLVVAIMFLVFLGIYLRDAAKTHETEGKDVASFLEAITKFTIECDYIGASSPLSDLILECDASSISTCSSGEKKCDVLRNTLNQAINSSWNFNENSPTKAYFMDVFKETDKGEKALFNSTPITSGILTNNIRAAEKPFSKGIILRLEIYY